MTAGATASGGPVRGQGIIAAAWAGTVIYALSAVIAVFSPAMRPLAALVAIALFAAGSAACMGAVVAAAARSRTEELAVASVFLFQGDAPRAARANLFGATLVQIVVALGTVAARPYTSLAFGVLVWTFGVGLAGLWGARHGTFPPRQPPPGRNARPPRGRAR